MKKIRPCYMLMFVSQLGANAQCNCTDIFQFVKHEIENNYAGFKDKTKDKNRYNAFTSGYADKASKIDKFSNK